LHLFVTGERIHSQVHVVNEWCTFSIDDTNPNPDL